MSNPKRHHYVPKMLQKHFTNPSGYLFTYDARNGTLGVRPERSEQLFVQRHMYSSIGQDGSRDPELEIRFSELEGAAYPVIAKIISAVRQDQLPSLSNKERVIWDNFFIGQWRRVPTIKDKIMSEEALQRELAIAMNELSRRGRSFSSEDKRHFSEQATMDRMRQNSFVGVLSLPAKRPLQVLQARGLVFGHVTNPEMSLILGSVPLVRMSSTGRSALEDESVELWLPIANDVAVSPGSYREREAIFPIKSRNVRHINQAIASQSVQIACGIERTVLSLRKIVNTRDPSY